MLSSVLFESVAVYDRPGVGAVCVRIHAVDGVSLKL